MRHAPLCICMRRLDEFFKGPEIDDEDYIGDVVTEMIITATQMGNDTVVGQQGAVSLCMHS
jgi:hypothetical protein